MKNKKGFTLVELLVVVLIIGILAAIAVPQYQVAVAKSEYSNLKAKTRALAEAANRYKLATGTTPKKLADLDISLPDVINDEGCTGDGCGFDVFFNDDKFCAIWGEAKKMVACFTKGQKMGFYFKYNTLTPMRCYTKKDYETGNKVCQQETGKTKEQAEYCGNNDDICTYYY